MSRFDPHVGFEVMGHNSVKPVEIPPTFQRNISPQSSRSNKPRNTSLLATCFHPGSLLVESVCYKTASRGFESR
jgi:hypothetical protein